MSTEEIYDRTDGSDPAGLPVLLSAPAVRPGRQRGAFSMTAHTSLPRPAALDRLRKRQDAPSPTWEPVDLKAADAVVDWSQVAMFRTMVATRLAGVLRAERRPVDRGIRHDESAQFPVERDPGNRIDIGGLEIGRDFQEDRRRRPIPHGRIAR